MSEEIISKPIIIKGEYYFIHLFIYDLIINNVLKR